MLQKYYGKERERKERERNYRQAQDRIRSAMQNGEPYVYLPGKNNSANEFTWVAMPETIERLRADGFNIDKVWDPYEYWSVEWGY